LPPRACRGRRGGDHRHRAIFATATGIVGAVVTLMGLLAFRPCSRPDTTSGGGGRGDAGGCLRHIDPPSVLLIVYGAVAGVSVVQLYAALSCRLHACGALYRYIIVLASVEASPHASARRERAARGPSALRAGADEVWQPTP